MVNNKFSIHIGQQVYQQALKATILPVAVITALITARHTLPAIRKFLFVLVFCDE